MPELVPYVDALFYVPLTKAGNLPALMKRLRIRLTKTDMQDTAQDEFGEESDEEAEAVEIECYDTSRPGYIGVPRAFGIEKFGHLGFVDKTSKPLRRFYKFPQVLKPRDKVQAEFWQHLAAVCKAPRPTDVVFNAVTGAGKTETCLYEIAAVLQVPTLITVPTNKLRRQWYARIIKYFGAEWAEKYVGHIQQNKMDYQGRLIVLGLAPSLAFRSYPRELREYFGCLWIDEFHKIGAPRMSQILFKYPASLRVGGTATNRLDALRRMCDLHMGAPRVKSKQKVMAPLVHVVSHRTELPRGFEIQSPFTVRSHLARRRERNDLLARLIYERGFLRGRNVLFLSDDTRQLQHLQKQLVRTYGVPAQAVGLIVGEYYTGKWRINRKGNRVKEKLAMTEQEQDRVAAECQIVGATYGIFDTGADVARLDMGVECTPRGNVRQAMGRVQRIMEGKPQVEWYSIFDQVYWYDPDRLAQSRANGVFASPVAVELEKLADPEAQNRARMSSFRDQGGRVIVFKGFADAN